MKRIPVSGPWITDKEIAYVTDAARSAWFEGANVYYDRFEKAFAGYLGTRFAISLPSCTSALHLSLLAAGVGPGDEVIVPDVTWIATAAPISYVGATPVFCDIDAATWCLDPKSFAERITARTKAVIPVDLYGNLAAWDEILDIARKKNVFVIEDAAEALGARYRGKPAGSLGDVGVFSFHGSKTFTTGEGGMLVTNDQTITERCRFLRDHGRRPGDVSFMNQEVAYKYKMSALQAALGLAQIERAEEIIARKVQTFRWYEDRLAGLPGVTLNQQASGNCNSYWMVTTLVDKELGLDKTELAAQLSNDGIDTRPFFSPLSSLPAYRNHPQAQTGPRDNPVSYAIGARGINLPSHLLLTEADVDRVCTSFKGILTSARRPNA